VENQAIIERVGLETGFSHTLTNFRPFAMGIMDGRFAPVPGPKNCQKILHFHVFRKHEELITY
jgi:hypothetical protein